MSDTLQQNFQNSTPFLRGYRELKIPIIDNGNPAWGELFPLKKIDELREIVGPRHFSAQMMLEYIDEARARLDPGALIFYNGEFDARMAKIGDKIITGCALYWDPSGAKTDGDNSVIVMLYRDDKNRCAYVHDVKYLSVGENDLHPLATQCEIVLDFMRTHNQYRIAIETNGLGSALPEIIRDIAKRRGQNIFVQKIVNHTRKETRILDAIEPLLSTGRLYANEKIKYTPLISEMLGWTASGAGAHDDGIDAVAGALRLTPTPIRALGTVFRPMVAQTDFKV